MRQKIQAILLFMALLFAQKTIAQSNLYVSSFVADSTVYLRWYPKDQGTWQRMLKYGVMVGRLDLNSGVPESEFANSLRPEGFQPDWHRIDSMAGLQDGAKWGFVEEIIRANGFKKPETIAGLVNSLDETQNGFLTAMMLIHTDPQLAEDFGMMAKDRCNAKQGKCIYLLYIPDSLNSDTQCVIVDHIPENTQHRPDPPILEQQGSEIRISWNDPDRHAPWFGFYIERSLDTGLNFSPLHELPMYYGIKQEGFTNDFTDSLPPVPGLVQYRFHALNSFDGKGEYSEVSEIDFHFGMLRSPTLVQMSEETGKPCIYWQMDTAELMPLSGFEIYRADSIDGFMDLIGNAGANQREWIFTEPGYENYISVSAVFENGERRSSDPVFISFPDTFPPMAVQNVRVLADTCGMVRVSWSPAAESAFRGYQVYRSNTRHAEFSNLSKAWITDTVFADTLDLLWLRDSIFYFIMVADDRYNETASDTCAVPLPSQIPPAAPLILSCYQNHDHVEIRYSGSHESKRMPYELFRSDNGGTPLLLRVFDSMGSGTLQDKLVVPGHHYAYKMRTKNDRNLYSEWSPEVAVTAADNPLPERISINRVWCDTALKRVVISWDLSSNAVEHYRIYRLTNGKAETIGNVNGDVNEFVCRTSENADKMTFKIIAYYKDERKSL